MPPRGLLEALSAKQTPQAAPSNGGLLAALGAMPRPQPMGSMNLTPQETFLYQHHLQNLIGPGKVMNADGSISTIFQFPAEHGGKFYNIPTVWDGKILSADEAKKRAAKIGWDKWPSYSTPEEADARYMRMHDAMDSDVGSYLENQ